MTRIHLDQAAIHELTMSEGTRLALKKVGDSVAERAAQAAPKRTGGGAESIHAEEAVDGEVRVGWDRDHFYMLFAEVGTSKHAARPFLRPALDAQYEA
jgi:HK97 gp10 family phage protein